MANEVVIVELYGDEGDVTSFTCAAGTTISGGTTLKLSDPNTVVAATLRAAGAGIAYMDKSSADPSTRISVVTNAKVQGKASGAITLGLPVSFADENYFIAADAAASGSKIVGYALETFSDAEVGMFRLRL